MQSATLSVRPCSLPLVKTSNLNALGSPSSVGPRSLTLTKFNSLSLNATPPIHLPPLSFKAARLGFSTVVRAASESAAGDVNPEPKEDGGSLLQTLQLGSLFALWYLFNIYFNIYNKQVRIIFPCYHLYCFCNINLLFPLEYYGFIDHI
jgi:solute carrier family 35, member E1